MKYRIPAILFAAVLIMCFPADYMAQGNRYQLKDSVNVRDKHRMRQWSYENNQTNYPAPKKANPSVGLKVGYPFVAGDVRPDQGIGGAVNYRHGLGHAFSLRGELAGGVAKGQNWRKSTGIVNNPAMNGTLDATVDYTGEEVLHNFRMRYWDVSVQGVLNFNNLNFYAKTPKWSLYGFFGLGAFFYQTNIDQLDASGARYDYSAINSPEAFDADARKAVLNWIRDTRDGTYESEAEFVAQQPFAGNYAVNPNLMGGLGLAMRLSDRIDIALEHRVTITGDDLLDGQRWEETNTPTGANDYFSFTSIGINFRLGKGEDSQWWSNPMDEPLNRIRMMATQMSKGEKDSDGDGVVDSRDQEKQTPKGAKVDVRGIALDSDDDGIPDFKDKQPFSPKDAQVDKSGVALDSDSDGVPDIFDQDPNTKAGAQVDVRGNEIKGGSSTIGGGPAASANMMMPMVNFDFGSSEIKQEYFPQLYRLARMMHDHPDVKIHVVGHADNRNTTDFNKKLSEKRAQNCVDFMTKNFGISATRFDISHKGADDPLIKDLPNTRGDKYEKFHYLNRRVEFIVAE